jgi:hypothetical protein
MTILVSAAVAVLLAAGTAWGQDAPPADDQEASTPRFPNGDVQLVFRRGRSIRIRFTARD